MGEDDEQVDQGGGDEKDPGAKLSRIEGLFELLQRHGPENATAAAHLILADEASKIVGEGSRTIPAAIAAWKQSTVNEEAITLRHLADAELKAARAHERTRRWALLAGVVGALGVSAAAYAAQDLDGAVALLGAWGVLIRVVIGDGTGPDFQDGRR